MDELKEWMSTEDAAKLTGYHVKYLRELVRKGRILAHKVSRDWLVNRDSLLEYKRHMLSLGTDKHNPWRDDLDNGRGRTKAKAAGV